MDFLQYTPKDAVLHKLDPCSKFLFFLVFTIFTSLVSNGAPLLLLLACFLIIWAKGKILPEMGMLLKKLKILILFILLVWTVIGLFSVDPGPVIYRAGRLSIEWYDFYKSLVFVIRIYLMVAVFFTVIITTNFSDIILGLRKIKVPYIVAFGVGLIFQIIPIIVGEFNAIMDAQKSRGLELDKCGKIQKMKNYVTMSFPLLFRVLNKGHSISLAMYYYKLDFKVKRTAYKRTQPGRRDALFLISVFLILAAACALHFLLPYNI